LMLDRIGLIAPRLTALPAEDAEWTKELLTEVRIGIDLVRLRRLRRHVSKETAREFETILQALARYFSTDAFHPPSELLEHIDTCMEGVSRNEEDPLRRDALLALLDSRRGLFPDAAPYKPSAPQELEPELAA
jgi:Fusaric acid resistance protein family